jgi:hypothetical protein
VFWHAVLGSKPGRCTAILGAPAPARAAILAAQRPSEVDLEALQRNEPEGLLAQLVAQRARLQQQGELAMEMGDVRGGRGRTCRGCEP